MRFIDSHVHFYDTERPEKLLWPTISSGIYWNATPQVLQASLTALKPTATIAIETSRRWSDDQWLLNYAVQQPMVAAVIANLDIASDGFPERLSCAKRYEKFRGLRLRPMREINLRSDALRDRIALLEKSANIVEAGCDTTKSLLEFATLAADFPKVQFVLDHFGHPQIDGKKPSALWEKSVQRFARLPNTRCKITSLIQFSNNVEQALGFYEHILKILFDAFSPSRLLYGSNWPPVLNTGGYENNFKVLSQQTIFGADCVKKIFFSNALNLYRIENSTLQAEHNCHAV